MKVKKWLLGLVTFAAMVVVCAVCAGAETFGDFEYSVRDDGTVEITGYSGSAEKVDIPEKIDGKSVTRIGDEAFEYSRLASITIPDSVTSIGSYAFYFCTNLRSVTIPDNGTKIYRRAFFNCTSLKSVTIPASVKFIGPEAFGYWLCNDENKILDGFVINYTKNTYGHYYATKNGFSSETCLLTEELDNGTLAIKGYAGFDKIFTVPSEINGKKVTEIGDSVFKDCLILTSVTIPNSVTSVGDRAFWGCANLTSITIPDSVMSIGFIAFSDCSSLKSVTIPDSVTSIGDSAFGDCTSLTAIDVTIGNKNYTSVNGVLFNKDKTELICYPAGKTDKSYIIPDSVISMGYSAFRSCVNLTRIIIPDSVTEIAVGNSAFQNCKNLMSITIPDGAISIGSYAFMNCESLVSITIPGSVSKIGWDAFNGCTNLTSIAILGSVTEIADGTFWDCESLTSITIPNSVTSIGDYAFGGCTSLKSITIPDSVKNIGEHAFGYNYNYDNGYKKIDNFKIFCYSGTAGEKYAKDNGFAYELLDQPTIANVTGFKVKSIFSTNVTLQWNKNTSASGYEIEQYKSGKWVNVAKITGNATTSYTVKGLAAGTAGYKFRMRAVKDGAYSDYTSTLSVNTNPYGVGGFKCSSKSSTSVTLKWNKGTTASGYQLQQYKDGKWVTIYTGTKATNTSYTVKGLKAGTAGYRFRIRAYKTYGNTKQYGSWSSEVKVNTNPYGVGGFKCSSKTSTSVTLKWNKGTTASGYQLQQYKGGKWVTIYTGTKATNTSFTVKGLKAGTAGYRFRIRAYKTYGNTKQYGSWSSEVKVNTNPYGVGGFKAKSTAKNSITLGWNKGTTASGYQLQQYKGGKWVTVYTGAKATSTSCTIKSLKANTSYKFRIRAYKTYGNTKQYGSWSKVLTVRTKK